MNKEELVENKFQELEKQIGNEPSKESLNLISLSSLLKEKDEETPWLVNNLLILGGTSLLAGKPKVGKSTLARNLALAIAQGKDFFNRETHSGPVIYLALEEKRTEVRKHFRDLGAIDENIHICTSSLPSNAFELLKKAAEELIPALIIIDPLFRLVRVRDLNDYAQVTQALEPITTLARETGSHILCVHHLGKGDRSGGDSILGSTGILAAVDTALMLRKEENSVVISSEQRYGPNMEKTVIQFDMERRGVTLGGTKENEDLNLMGQAICEFLTSSEGPITETEIKSEVEGKNQTRGRALRDFVAQGKIIRTGKGTKSEPYQYSIPTDSSSQVPTYSKEQEDSDHKIIESTHNNKVISGSNHLTENQNNSGLRGELGNLSGGAFRTAE